MDFGMVLDDFGGFLDFGGLARILDDFGRILKDLGRFGMVFVDVGGFGRIGDFRRF